MIWLVKLLQKRPTDISIRLFRIVFWSIISISVYYSLIYTWWNLEDDIFWLPLNEESKLYLKYFYVSLWIFPIIIWLTNLCLLKTKYMRIFQIIYAWLIFIASENIASTDSLWVDTLLIFMWFIPLIAWVTWKCITSKCLKYKEVITKIRV